MSARNQGARWVASVNQRNFMMLLTGAPGVGKGTFSKRLTRDLNIPLFEVGAFLREMIKSENCTDPRILAIKGGNLVPDELICQIFKDKLDSMNVENIIVDGFPRTVPQAEFLDTYKNVDFVLNLHLDYDILTAKIAGRRVCPTSGETYNVFQFKENGYDMDPLLPKKDPERCDVTGEILVRRDDDNPETVAKRLKIYEQSTQPILDYYKQAGKLVTFEPKKGVKDYPEVLEIVKRKMNAKPTY